MYRREVVRHLIMAGIPRPAEGRGVVFGVEDGSASHSMRP
jgi:hypothetical protein